MEDVKQIEFWRNKCHDWQEMYNEQKDIALGYKKIIEEYRLLMGIPNESDLKKDYIEKDGSIA